MFIVVPISLPLSLSLSATKMGFLTILVDMILVLFFLTIAILAPILDFQNILPIHLYPTALVDLNVWYMDISGDYLFNERPSFFVGLIWVELFVLWPISVLNLVGILGRKPWFPTTCLIYGVSCFTAMVAILAEMIGSGRASNTMFMVYISFLAHAAIAILRGLLTHTAMTTTSNTTKVGTKKRN